MNRMNGPATPNLVRKRSASPSARSSMPLPTTSIGHRRSEEHTSELQSQSNLVCRLLLEKKKHQFRDGRGPSGNQNGYDLCRTHSSGTRLRQRHTEPDHQSPHGETRGDTAFGAL